MYHLVLGRSDDEHALHVYQVLKGRGCKVSLVDSSDFPGRLRLTLRYSSHGGSGRSELLICLDDGISVSADEIRSIYWRNYGGIKVPEGIVEDPMQNYVATNDSRGLFESFLAWPTIKWVNGWNGFRMHQTKPLALELITKLGVKVPLTLVSNDPSEVKAFVDQNENLIFKPVQGGAHTRRLTRDYLTDEHLNNLQLSPVTLQEEIKGTNVRVFVIGTDVVALEISTPALDFRDDKMAKIIPFEPSKALKNEALAIAKALHLSWTGIDYRVSSNGDYYFLEANPSPMFIGFEALSGVPLTALICDYLSQDKF